MKGRAARNGRQEEERLTTKNARSAKEGNWQANQ